MKRMLVIGVGSVLMTDDGIGVLVADALRGMLRVQDVAVLVGETDVRFCLEELRADDFLVILDAVMPGSKPGRVTVTPLRDVIKAAAGPQAQHDYSLADAVAENYPDMAGCLIGIEASVIGFGLELSPALRERFDQICDGVLRTILELREAATDA
jgi:hydrogenase maturation protease